MLSDMDLVFVRTSPDWAILHEPGPGTRPFRGEFDLEGELEGLFLDDDLLGQPDELQWNYIRVIESDGNGTVYLDYCARTRKNVAELFYETIFTGFSDSIPHPDPVDDHWTGIMPAEIEIASDDLITFTVTQGPNGELALNGGAFRVWAIELFTLQDVFTMMRECDLIQDYLSTPQNIAAILEKFKEIEG